MEGENTDAVAVPAAAANEPVGAPVSVDSSQVAPVVTTNAPPAIAVPEPAPEPTPPTIPVAAPDSVAEPAPETAAEPDPVRLPDTAIEAPAETPEEQGVNESTQGVNDLTQSVISSQIVPKEEADKPRVWQMNRPSEATPKINAAPIPYDHKAPTRPYMTVEASIMGTCQVCAGCVRHDPGKGGIVCALPPDQRVDCILPRLLRAVEAKIDPNDTAALGRRSMLLNMATPNWCLQNARNTGSLPE